MTRIKPGYGYWETDYYPIGAYFRRAKKSGLEIAEILRTFPNVHGSNSEGITADGRKVCFHSGSIETTN